MIAFELARQRPIPGASRFDQRTPQWSR